MVDVREVIAEAVPCNIVYGRPQAADAILCALSRAGFRIIGPDEVKDVRRIVEIANRNEWSAEGDRLARALGRKE